MVADGSLISEIPAPPLPLDRSAAVPALTVVIPLRVTRERCDALERLRSHPSHDTEVPDCVQFLVVDDGSPAGVAAEIERACREKGYAYLHLPTEDQMFSIGRCRNAGAMHARSDLILFQDLDLIPPVGFYHKLFTEIRIQRIRETATSFLMIPCIYLTRNGLSEFWDTPASEQAQRFHHYALVADRARVERVSTGTSINVYNRRYFLARGGNDPAFSGWGYEDLEFNNRCINIDSRFPKPRDWTVETGTFNNVIEYRGWKANYRLYGDLLWSKGLALFHAWHPVEHESSYIAGARANRRRFIEKLSGLGDQPDEPEPLADISRGRTLSLRRNTFTAHRETRPYFGTHVFASEDDFDSEQAFASYIDTFAIDRVLFHNPYASERMLDIYRWTRSLGLEHFVAERGALNDSFFFDPGGFLAESSTYARENWDVPLSETARQQVLDYIAAETSSGRALEAQPGRIGADALRRRLGLRREDIVIFVALQRPSDSATRFMVRGDRTYDRFIDMLRALDGVLPAGVRVLVKKHPLEDEVPAFSSFINVDEVHVSDLLEVCSCVLTFNSGVGVLAMLWKKSVLMYGSAFYQIDGVNRYVDTAADVLAFCSNPAPLDETLLERFVHYLRFRFYSIGKFATEAVRMPSGERMTATLDIEIRELRIPGFPAVEYRAPDTAPSVTWDAPLFDRYRYAEESSGSLPINVAGRAKVTTADLVECTALVSPAIATAFARPLVAEEVRLLPYAEYQVGAWAGYKPETGSGCFTVEALPNREVPYVPASCPQALRFRTVNGSDIRWSLLEFVIEPEQLRVGGRYEFRGVIFSQSPQKCWSGLYIHRIDGGEPRCHVMGHLLDHRERLLRNEFRVNENTFASMVPGSRAVFYIQFPGEADLDLMVRYIAVYKAP